MKVSCWATLWDRLTMSASTGCSPSAQSSGLGPSMSMFRWLEVLEKEFDKAFVDVDLLLGEIDPDQVDITYEGRQKMTTLSSCFAQLCHKTQTVFQLNHKLEVRWYIFAFILISKSLLYCVYIWTRAVLRMSISDFSCSWFLIWVNGWMVYTVKTPVKPTLINRKHLTVAPTESLFSGCFPRQ